MNINKVNVSLEYQEELDVLKNYNQIVNKYQELQNNIIQELSKFSTLIIEDKFEYKVIQHIDMQLKQRHNQQYTLGCRYFDKNTYIESEYGCEMTLLQLCNEIVSFNSNFRIITEEKEINMICRWLKLT